MDVFFTKKELSESLVFPSTKSSRPAFQKQSYRFGACNISLAFLRMFDIACRLAFDDRDAKRMLAGDNFRALGGGGLITCMKGLY